MRREARPAPVQDGLKGSTRVFYRLNEASPKGSIGGLVYSRRVFRTGSRRVFLWVLEFRRSDFGRLLQGFHKACARLQ